LNGLLERTSRVRLARWLLATAIFGATMALGAVHTVVLVPVTLLVLAATMLAWLGGEPLRARRSASLVLWTSVGLTAWTFLQTVPLQAQWVAWIAPHTAEVWSRALSPLAVPGPTWITLSLDPVATRVEVLRGVTYTLCFAAASRIAVRREGAQFLERMLVVTGLLLALAAVLHPALGAEAVFGIYHPVWGGGGRHLAPLLNRNVLSGFLNITLALLLGQLLSPRPLWPRSLLTALTLLLIGMQVWVGSRGGLLGTVLVVALVSWMSRSLGPEDRGVVKPFIIPGLLVVAGLAMVVLATSDAAFGEVTNADTSKLELARQALKMVPQYPVTGIGRGAFESVFPAFRTGHDYVTYNFPENFIAQWFTEWGVVPSLAALGVLAVALRPTTALARSPRAAGAWGAIAAVAVQDLVNFGTEHPAIVMALTVTAAIVTGGTSGTDQPRRVDVWARRPAILVALAAAATCGALVRVAGGLHHELHEERESLRAKALDASVGRAEFDVLAGAAMERHPAEPYLPFAGAVRAARAGDDGLMPWIERTLERSLLFAPAHLLLARWLAPRSRSQARLEYRLTLEQDPNLMEYVKAGVPQLISGYYDATEVVPDTFWRKPWLEFLSGRLAPRLPATAERLDDLIVAVEPNDGAVAARRAHETLEDVLAGESAPWCGGEGKATCLKKGLELSARLETLRPVTCDGYATHARFLVESGDRAAGLKELSSAANNVTDRTACFESLAELGMLTKSDDTVNHALDRIAHAGCLDDQECVQNLSFVADHEIARGNERSALAALQRAHDKMPSSDPILERVASLASRVQLHADSLRAYQALATRHPDDPRWPLAVQAEKDALVAGSIHL
jgi:hypothetical protein